ncbi:hypothetical protein ACOMHN_066088 [Nucella lapillus]
MTTRVCVNTGAVKITPAHDPNDYDCGVRHKLPFVTIIDNNGNISADCGQFAKMKRFDARKAVLKALQEKGLYRDTKDNPMVVPMCSRSKDVIEPLLKPQWYVNCKQMAADAVKVVREGDLKVLPEMHHKTWYQWLENCRDWCISRQLWWGHRIPAYFVTVDDPSVPAGKDTDGQYWVTGRSEEEARQKAAQKFNVSEDKISLHQDEDVLDTWFSSALFPFSIFGWPDKTPDLAAFYPGHLLETGHDILFFWVARMVMFGLTLLGKLPFTEVYLHAMVRDSHGRKMSKSLGNIIDPVNVICGINLKDLHETLQGYNLDEKEFKKAIEGQKQDYPQGIPECGTDALRFALVSYTSQGRDINMDVLRVQGYRFFCNKLWNATKFALNGLGADFTPTPAMQVSGKETEMDRWILSRLSDAVQLSNRGMETYDFPSATTAIYNFWLYELCDWYLEAIKPVLYGEDEAAKGVCRNVLYTCLDAGLRLLHPLMPFVTEELYQRLPRRSAKDAPSICVTPYPEAADFQARDTDLEADVEFTQLVVKTIRSIRADYMLLPKMKIEVYLRCSDDSVVSTLRTYCGLVTALANTSDVHFLREEMPPAGCAMLTVSAKCEAHVLLKGVIDVEKEVGKLGTKKETLSKQLQKLQDAAAVPTYHTKVPEDVRSQNTDKVRSLCLLHLSVLTVSVLWLCSLCLWSLCLSFCSAHCVCGHCVCGHCVCGHCVCGHCVCDHCVCGHCVCDHCVCPVALLTVSVVTVSVSPVSVLTVSVLTVSVVTVCAHCVCAHCVCAHCVCGHCLCSLCLWSLSVLTVSVLTVSVLTVSMLTVSVLTVSVLTVCSICVCAHCVCAHCVCSLCLCSLCVPSVSVLTVSVLTVSVLTVSVLTVSVLTVSVLTVSVLTVSVLTVSVLTVSVLTVSVLTVSVLTVSVLTVSVLTVCSICVCSHCVCAHCVCAHCVFHLCLCSLCLFSLGLFHLCLFSLCLCSLCLCSLCLCSLCLFSLCLFSLCLFHLCLCSLCLCSLCLFSLCLCSLCLFSLCLFSLCLFHLCLCSLCLFSLCLFSLCLFHLCLCSLCLCSLCLFSLCLCSLCLCSLCLFSLCLFHLCLCSLCLCSLCLFSLCLFHLCLFHLCLFHLCLFSLDESSQRTDVRKLCATVSDESSQIDD